MEKTCDYCGKQFDEDYARDEFEMTCPKNYDYLTKSLCAECAISAIDDEDNGIYLELCEKCGTRFDPFVDEQELCNRTGDDGATIDMFDKYLCLNCSLDEYADKCYVPNDEEYDDDDDDDDGGESLSAYDAALIWASNGKDEDYTFGYSEDELEAALQTTV